MKIVGVFICVLLCFSCKEQHKPVNSMPEKSSFQLYSMSEMALLMEQLYVDNKRIKDAILSDANIADSLPSHYLNLSTAVLTDPTDRDLFFDKQMTEFIKAQRLVYEVESNRKENFNAMVQSCISCHQVKCGGPIERIKKLLIP